MRAEEAARITPHPKPSPMGSKSASDFAVMDFSSQQRFADGQILLIDKPLEWTSVRRGQQAPLGPAQPPRREEVQGRPCRDPDPLATGVLVICTGRATKAIEGLQSDAKSYTATIRLGATTPCLDAELPVSEWVDAEHIDKAAIVALPRSKPAPSTKCPALQRQENQGQKAYAVARGRRSN